MPVQLVPPGVRIGTVYEWDDDGPGCWRYHGSPGTSHAAPLTRRRPTLRAAVVMRENTNFHGVDRAGPGRQDV